MSDTISCGGDEFRFPHGVRSQVTVDKTRIVVLDPEEPGHQTPDVILPEASRNVVGVDSTCELAWVVERSPDDGSEVGPYHLVSALNDVVRLRAGRRIHSLDPIDGRILDSWDGGLVTIGDEEIVLERPIQDRVTVDGITVVHTERDYNAHTSWTYGFDEAGTELWKRRDRHWQLEARGGLVRLRSVQETRRGNLVFDLDPRTGKIVSAHDGPPEYVAGTLDFCAIDGFVVYAWKDNVTVFDEDGTVGWQRNFETPVRSALRHEDQTVIKRDSNRDGFRFVLSGIDDDGVVEWLHWTDFDTEFASRDGDLYARIADEKDQLEFRVDTDRGEVIEQVSGARTETAQKILEE